MKSLKVMLIELSYFTFGKVFFRVQFHENCHTDKKSHFATYSDLSVEITDPETIETMVGDVIDTFRNTTPTVNKEFGRKSQFETRTCHMVSYLKSICQSRFFRFRHFAAQCSRNLHSKQREKEQLPAKKRPFFTVYTCWLNSLMTSKSFGQDTKRA